MLKIFRSSKKDAPEKGADAVLPLDGKDSTTQNEPLSFSGDDCPDKATAVLTGFMDTIFNEGAHNWSPEEREKRIDACLVEIASIQRAEDRRDIEDTSRKIRQQIQTGEFDSRPLTRQMTPQSPSSVAEKRVDGVVGSILAFHKELAGRDNWTPQELEVLKAECLSRTLACRREEDAKSFDEVHQIVLNEYGVPIQSAPHRSTENRMTAKQLVDTVASHIQFE